MKSALLPLASACLALTLSACSPAPHTLHANAFPMGQPGTFNQPVPDKPLFDTPILTSRDLLLPAKPDVREPLPPLAALPKATDIDRAAASPGNPSSDGAVNPAAGQAAAITDGQGEKHELGAPTSAGQ